MKYSGYIFGLLSSDGSIYSIATDDSRCYVWKANVFAELNGKMLVIRFNWNGDAVELILTMIKNNYYTGKVNVDRIDAGTCYYWGYNNGEMGIFMKGGYIENEVPYDSFIDLKPSND